MPNPPESEKNLYLLQESHIVRTGLLGYYDPLLYSDLYATSLSALNVVSGSLPSSDSTSSTSAMNLSSFNLVLPVDYLDVSYPSGWLWTSMPFTIEQSVVDGSFRPVNFDVSDLMVTGSGVYYVSPDGNDSNTGRTSSDPLRKFSTAAAKSDVDIIYLAPGYYTKIAGGGTNATLSRSMSIIGTGSGVYLSQDYGIYAGWSASGNAYVAGGGGSGSFIARVFDGGSINVYGNYSELTWKSSSALVSSNPGSWFLDTSASKIYIRTYDSRMPDTNVHIMSYAGGVLGYAADNRTIYLENVNLEGGDRVAYFRNSSSAGGSKFYAKNSTFKYGFVQNGVQLSGIDSILQECHGSDVGVDFVNYDTLNTINPTAIEIDCTSIITGTSAVSSANGSSGHTYSTIVRIGCNYDRSYGPIYNDIGTSYIWMLGCSAGSSLSLGGFLTEFAFGSTGSAVKIWMDSCTSLGGTAQDILTAGSTYVRNFSGSGTNYIYPGTGAIISY